MYNIVHKNNTNYIHTAQAKKRFDTSESKRQLLVLQQKRRNLQIINPSGVFAQSLKLYIARDCTSTKETLFHGVPFFFQSVHFTVWNTGHRARYNLGISDLSTSPMKDSNTTAESVYWLTTTKAGFFFFFLKSKLTDFQHYMNGTLRTDKGKNRQLQWQGKLERTI